MASHEIAISKATFAASLLRPDPIAVSRDDITLFHSLLSAVSTQCSPMNIQKCKQWVLSNVIQSSARVIAFAKFLVALSTSFSDAERRALILPKLETSAKRKRLHLLYLISDLIHHTKTYTTNSVGDLLRPLLTGLFSSAASFKGSPKHQRKIAKLLDIWEEKHYYPTNDINKIRAAVEIAQRSESLKSLTTNSDSIASNNVVKGTKDVPYTMPSMHGDQNLPWYDLPAANLMQHIVPNSTRPIDPSLVKPILFVAGQAEEGLIAAVKSFLEKVESIDEPVACHDQTEYPAWDVDEIGRQVFRDEFGDVVVGDEGYYGWSTALCEDMKRKFSKHGSDESPRVERFRTLNRDSSRSRSSSRDSPCIKKRRYPSSHLSSRSWSRSRSRSRSGSGSGSRSKSRSRSRSRDLGQSRYRGRNIMANATDASQPGTTTAHSSVPLYHPRNKETLPPLQPMAHHVEQGQQYKEWPQPPSLQQLSNTPSPWQQPIHSYRSGWSHQYPLSRDSQQEADTQGAPGHGHNDSYPGY